MTNSAEAAFEAYRKTTHYMTEARWSRDFPERIPECLWRSFLAGFNTAIATEAQRAEATKIGSVEDEGAGPKDIAQ